MTLFQRHLWDVELISNLLCESENGRGKFEANGSNSTLTLNRYIVVHNTHSDNVHPLSAGMSLFLRFIGGDSDSDKKSACCSCFWVNSFCFCFSTNLLYFSSVFDLVMLSSNDFVCLSNALSVNFMLGGVGRSAVGNLYGGYSRALTIGLMADGSPKVKRLLLFNKLENCDEVDIIDGDHVGFVKGLITGKSTSDLYRM